MAVVRQRQRQQVNKQAILACLLLDEEDGVLDEGTSLRLCSLYLLVIHAIVVPA